MLDDQSHVLDQLGKQLASEDIDALIIAGDLYDRPIPPTSGVTLLNNFLRHVILELNIPVILIPGNHDSAERLNFGSDLLSAAGLHILTDLSNVHEPVTLEKGNDRIHLYGIPYIDPAHVREAYDVEVSQQLPALPPVESFWDALPEFFAWLESGLAPEIQASYAAASGETILREHTLRLPIAPVLRPHLEVIRFAAANRLCVDLDYDGSTRRVEPYSLRRTKDNNIILHAWNIDKNVHRSYRIDRIQGARTTNHVFSPRYAVELTPLLSRQHLRGRPRVCGLPCAAPGVGPGRSLSDTAINPLLQLLGRRFPVLLLC